MSSAKNIANDPAMIDLLETMIRSPMIVFVVDEPDRGNWLRWLAQSTKAP